MASVSIEEYWIKARCQALKCESRSTTSFTSSSTETLLPLYFTHPHLSIVPGCYEAIGSLRLRNAANSPRLRWLNRLRPEAKKSLNQASPHETTTSRRALTLNRKGQKTKTLYHPNRYFNRSPPEKAIEIPFRVPIK